MQKGLLQLPFVCPVPKVLVLRLNTWYSSGLHVERHVCYIQWALHDISASLAKKFSGLCMTKVHLWLRPLSLYLIGE